MWFWLIAVSFFVPKQGPFARLAASAAHECPFLEWHFQRFRNSVTRRVPIPGSGPDMLGDVWGNCIALASRGGLQMEPTNQVPLPGTGVDDDKTLISDLQTYFLLLLRWAWLESNVSSR